MVSKEKIDNAITVLTSVSQYAQNLGKGAKIEQVQSIQDNVTESLAYLASLKSQTDMTPTLLSDCGQSIDRLERQLRKILMVLEMQPRGTGYVPLDRMRLQLTATAKDLELQAISSELNIGAVTAAGDFFRNQQKDAEQHFADMKDNPLPLLVNAVNDGMSFKGYLDGDVPLPLSKVSEVFLEMVEKFGSKQHLSSCPEITPKTFSEMLSALDAQFDTIFSGNEEAARHKAAIHLFHDKIADPAMVADIAQRLTDMGKRYVSAGKGFK